MTPPVIDVNAYLGEWPFRPLRHGTPGRLRRLLEGVGITRALVSPLGAIFRQECASANAEMMRALARHRDFFAPVPAVNPAYPGWQEDVLAARDAGAPGVRLWPNYHAYALDDPRVRAAAAQAAAVGLALFLSLRIQDERHHHPRMMVPAVAPGEVAALARALPDARIIACMARYGEAEELLRERHTAEGGCATSHQPGIGGNPPPAGNVWLDLSGVQGPTGCVDLLAERFGAERMLMGTGAPLQYPLPALAKVQASELSCAARDAVLGRTAAALLRLTGA